MRSLAALLWAGDSAALAYRAAGAYWAFDGARPGWVELFVPTKQPSPADWLILHKNSSLPPDEVRTLGPLAVTSPARTLLDLGAVIHPREVEHALEDAIRRNLTSWAELNQILARHAASGRNGVGVLRTLLEERSPKDAVLHTRFERRMLKLIKEAGLPLPERQHLVFDADDYPFAQIDLAYPEIKLGIECDSYKFHSGREAWEANLARRNKLTLLGWYIIHVTWRQLTTRPDKVLDEIRRGILVCKWGGIRPISRTKP
jgi:REase_MTES_1575